MLRAVAGAVLSLYPKAWRERYGEEVADLVTARPVRLRTVADLAAGAGDAWLHRRRIPGARPLRLPLAAVLVAGIYGLWLLWSPGARDLAGLGSVWDEAARAGSLADELSGTATTMFASAGALALLSLAQLGTAVRAAGKHAPLGAAARTTGRRVVVTGLAVVLPIMLVLTMYAGLMLDAGEPLGPLGGAITGGFFVPPLMALILPLPLIAATSPVLSPAARAAGKSLTVAAVLNAIAWLAVAVLVAMGLREASPWFVTSLAAGAVLSVGMAALVARAVLRRAPEDPVMLPERTQLGRAPF
ncbi:hypothetical protein FAF44_26395 [Nonomuraea sp. MG754425]|nr:hypothetical protein [Nonomuraea sp. MG754425]